MMAEFTSHAPGTPYFMGRISTFVILQDPQKAMFALYQMK